jgi:rhamnogalacturonan endolyase
LACATLPAVAKEPPTRFLEKLDRGLTAVHQADGRVFLSWRPLASDPEDTSFNVYRETAAPAGGATDMGRFAAGAPALPYHSIPLQTPAGYTPNDASLGDLDGDGQYEI